MDGSRTRWTLALIAVLLLRPCLVGEPPAVTGDWKFDVLRLKNGKVLTGLLLEESSSGIKFQIVRQNTGERTFVFPPTTFPHSEIQVLTPLKRDERQQLASRLKKLDPTGNGELLRMDDLELKPIPWGEARTGGLSYRSEYFVLESNTAEDIVRRAAVRLEDIYAAYSLRLPPRRKAAQPTRILLFQSPQDLAVYLTQQRLNAFNHAAFYDPSRNLIVCGSDLKLLGESLDLLCAKLKEYRADLEKTRQLYVNHKTGKPLPMPASVREMLRTSEQNFRKAEKSGSDAFARETLRLFQTLYHEAFHAYLANFVYPGGKGGPEVPSWLNEGLAQVFENAIVEAGDLRTGHPDEERLKRARAALSARPDRSDLVPLADLLRADPRRFLVQHGGNRQSADRHYLTSWALAFYLTFDRQLLGSDKLDAYIHACKPGVEPVQAFEKLTGQPLPMFEQSFHQYLRNLRPDGTTSPAPFKEPGR